MEYVGGFNVTRVRENMYRVYDITLNLREEREGETEGKGDGLILKSPP